VRRLLSALMLVAAVLAAATGALARPAQAAAGPGPGSFGIRLVDVPSAEADNPRALRYIIDHLGPGTTIHRRILVENLGPAAARITVYPDAATISGGSFMGDAGEARSDLTTWITTNQVTVALGPHANTMVTVTIRVPRDASSGERYGVIWAQETSRLQYRSGLAITEINRVGVRIYLSVGPGGAPPSNFVVTSLTATRSAHGQSVVVAHVHNTGGRALDISGYLKLSDGPGGLTAGPYRIDDDITIAPGQSEPMEVALSKRLPNGPWLAQVDLVSGLTERQAEATIQFPGYGARTAISGYLITGGILLIILAMIAAAWLVRRNRRPSPIPDELDLMLTPGGSHEDNPQQG
jgi:hypothetical protein